MKVARHEKIIELIRQYDIDTQEELAARLNEAGFKVTQATVSRDIRALKMTKVAGKDGKSHYAILSGPSAELGDKYTEYDRDPDGSGHGDGGGGSTGCTEMERDPGQHRRG